MGKYKLDINGTDYNEVTIEFIIKSLRIMPGIEPGCDNFLILDPEEPVQNSIYLQTMYCDEKFFAIETRIVHSDDSFTHYLYETPSLEETEKIFTEYYLYQKLPNITEWQDITDQM
jgi:hypothetical protein